MSLPPPADRAEELFLAACDLPAADRAVFLTQECGGDAELRRAVEALLADLDRAAAAGFLEAAPRPDESPRLPARTRLGDYELVRVLGEGGSGRVYEARHVRLGRRVAVKVLSAAALRDPTALARFRREIAAVGALAHPNAVAASDARQFGRHFSLVTDRQLAEGVQHLADNGLVHRDLSPSNVMVTTAGRVTILDLGLAALAAGGDRLTSTGLLVGTVGYVAPEQSEDARSVDFRSDLYGVGCLLHAMLVGHPPFRENPDVPLREWLNRLCGEPPPDVRRARPEVPDPVAEVCARLLATRAADRFDAPRAAAERLAPFAVGNALAETVRAAAAEFRGPAEPRAESLSQPRPVPRRRACRRGLVAASVAAALALGLYAAVSAISPRRDPPPVPPG